VRESTADDGINIILGVGVQNFKQLGGRADFLRHFIWSRVSDIMAFLDGADEGRATNSVQISEKARRPGQ
jgi:hypothetical protein